MFKTACHWTLPYEMRSDK